MHAFNLQRKGLSTSHENLTSSTQNENITLDSCFLKKCMDVLLSKAEECQQESHHQLQGMTIDHADLLWGPVLPEVEAQEEG